MDERDRKIISFLQRKGKAKLSEIAREVGISVMGVKKRLDKLERFVKFKPLIDVEKLGIIVAREVESSEALENILKKFERCSLRSQPGIGRFDIYPVQEIHYDSYMDLKVVADKVDDFAPCGVFCGECRRYEMRRCLGCPSTKFYRGKL